LLTIELMRDSIFAALAASTLAASGCAVALSPPAHGLPLESAATLPPGQTSVGGQLGVGTDGDDGGGAYVAARMRVGVAEHLDTSFEATGAGGARTDKSGARQVIRGAALRAGARFNPWRHLALTAGAGGGYTTFGSFFSPELGVILAYENEHLVPFVSARAGISVPIAPREVSFDGATREAEATWLLQGSTGVRVPIDRASLLAGVGLMILDADDQNLGFVMLDLGVGLECML